MYFMALRFGRVGPPSNCCKLAAKTDAACPALACRAWLPRLQASAMTRLDSLVQQVLLGGSGRWPGLLFRCALGLALLCGAFL